MSNMLNFVSMNECEVIEDYYKKYRNFRIIADRYFDGDHDACGVYFKYSASTMMETQHTPKIQIIINMMLGCGVIERDTVTIKDCMNVRDYLDDVMNYEYVVDNFQHEDYNIEELLKLSSSAMFENQHQLVDLFKIMRLTGII